MVKKLIHSAAKALLVLGLFISVSAVGFAADPDSTVYAESSISKWVRDSSGKRYLLANGNYVTNQMKRIDGAWYYFGEDSYMIKSQVVTVNNNQYYFGATGKRVTGWYIVDGDTYYFGSTGAMVHGQQTIGGKKYYFDNETGKLLEAPTSLTVSYSGPEKVEFDDTYSFTDDQLSITAAYSSGETIELTLADVTLEPEQLTKSASKQVVKVHYDKLGASLVAEFSLEAHKHNWKVTVSKQPTYTRTGSQTKSCAECGQTVTETIPVLAGGKKDDYLVIDYKVVNGKVMNMVTGKEVIGFTISGDYFTGGSTIRLPEKYTTFTAELIAKYNRASTNGLTAEYYGNRGKFLELSGMSSYGTVTSMFGYGDFGGMQYIHQHINGAANKVLPTGDIFVGVRSDLSKKEYTLQVNDVISRKSRTDMWCSYFSLHPDHLFKEIKIYATVFSEEEVMNDFKNSGCKNTEGTVIGRALDGIEGLGSHLAFTKDADGQTIPEWLETETTAGTYTVNDGNGLDLTYEIKPFEVPEQGTEKVSKYTSVHITKKPEEIPLGYKYAFAALPAPYETHMIENYQNGVFNGNGADPFDISWSVSDKSVAEIIDGLLIPHKEGTVTVTAKLVGTNLTDSCTVKIVTHENPADIVWNVPKTYISSNGYSFSKTNYEMTTRAIWDAIAEAKANGYTHIIFPVMDFYAAPIKGEVCYLPGNMTIEFPKGSRFYMMDSEIARKGGGGYSYFAMGYGRHEWTLPKDENGNYSYDYVENIHLIMDEYYGEYNKISSGGAALGANDFGWGNYLLLMQRYARFCSVEISRIRNATGIFMSIGGASTGSGQARILYSNLTAGLIDQNGNLIEDAEWCSTSDFIAAPANYKQYYHYALGNLADSGSVANGFTNHIWYNIYWYDANKKLIQSDEWQLTGEYYDNRPVDAKYFKISFMLPEVPTKEKWSSSSDNFISMVEDASCKFVEVKNCKLTDSADGLLSVVGATDCVYIHDNYVTKGQLSGSDWGLDLEDGWIGIRRSVLEHNIAPWCPIYISGGFSNFAISNYAYSIIAQNRTSSAMTRIINNTCVAITACDPVNIHVYYNRLTNWRPKDSASSNGQIYYYGNVIDNDAVRY